MMTSNLHCNHGGGYSSIVEWVRSHGEQPKGGQDYFRVTVESGGNDVTIFLSPDQLESLAARMSQAAHDRDVVLAGEATEMKPLDLASNE